MSHISMKIASWVRQARKIFTALHKKVFNLYIGSNLSPNLDSATRSKMNLFLDTASTPSAGTHSSKTYTVRATEEDNAKALRMLAIERGAGLLDDLTVTVEDLITDHEVAAKHGL